MTLARRARIATVALGAAVAATGLAVIAGWLLGVDRVAQPHPALESMPPQAALGFVLAGAAAAAIAAGLRRLGFALATAAAALGALALAGYLTGLDVRLGAPDQMAPNAAAALLLGAAALIVLSRAPGRRGRQAAVMAAMLEGGLAAAAVVQALAVLGGLSSSPLARMAPHAAGLHLALGGAAALLAVDRGEGARAVMPGWLPAATALIAPIATLVVWQLLGEGGQLLFGLIVAMLAPVSLQLWQSAREHAAELAAEVRARSRFQAQLAAKARDLETLIYIASHDLKEPLRAIESFSRMVEGRYAERLDDKGRDFLARIARAARRLSALLDDLLELSRAQRIAVPDTEIPLDQLVEAALSRLEPVIAESGASVEWQGDYPRLRLETTWATQAIYNLVANAIKFHRPGETARVEIAAYSGPEGEGLVVRDRGIGIEPRHAERVFQMFQRAVDRDVPGSGTGLAIVRQVAERHGGDAWAAPREGGGTEVYVTFGTSSREE